MEILWFCCGSFFLAPRHLFHDVCLFLTPHLSGECVEQKLCPDPFTAAASRARTHALRALKTCNKLLQAQASMLPPRWNFNAARKFGHAAKVPPSMQPPHLFHCSPSRKLLAAHCRSFAHCVLSVTA